MKGVLLCSVLLVPNNQPLSAACWSGGRMKGGKRHRARCRTALYEPRLLGWNDHWSPGCYRPRRQAVWPLYQSAPTPASVTPGARRPSGAICWSGCRVLGPHVYSRGRVLRRDALLHAMLLEQGDLRQQAQEAADARVQHEHLLPAPLQAAHRCLRDTNRGGEQFTSLQRRTCLAHV